jgi:hypothetical protein
MFNKVVSEGMDWIHLAQNSDKLRALVNDVINYFANFMYLLYRTHWNITHYVPGAQSVPHLQVFLFQNKIYILIKHGLNSK